MCRSIKTLRRPTPVTDAEIEAAARQFVRKVSGFREPSAKNAPAFEEAVGAVSVATTELLQRLPRSKAAPETASQPNGVRRTTTR